MIGLLGSNRRDSWTTLFLVSTAATSLTGFLFPFHGFTPGIGLGIVSLLILTIAIFARHAGHLAGSWRWLYVLSAMTALYLNVFVLIAQLFQKVPALRALAPTQSALPFVITQIFILATFVVLAITAAIRFRLDRV